MSRDRRPSVELSPAAHERKKKADRDRQAAKRQAEREERECTRPTPEVPRIAAQERASRSDGKVLGVYGIAADGSVAALWEPGSLEHESYAGWLDRKARERALPVERPVSVRVGSTRLSFYRLDGPEERERIARLVLDALAPDGPHAPEVFERIRIRLLRAHDGEEVEFLHR